MFIYQMERNPKYVGLSDPVFSWVEQTGHEAVTSTITMTELLVPPYRESDEHRVDEFYGLLSTYPNLRWIAPDLEAADIAARLRADVSPADARCSAGSHSAPSAGDGLHHK